MLTPELRGALHQFDIAQVRNVHLVALRSELRDGALPLDASGETIIGNQLLDLHGGANERGHGDLLAGGAARRRAGCPTAASDHARPVPPASRWRAVVARSLSGQKTAAHHARYNANECASYGTGTRCETGTNLTSCHDSVPRAGISHYMEPMH